MAIKHDFTSLLPDGPDPLQVQGHHWNEDHVIAAGTITPVMLAWDPGGIPMIGGLNSGAAPAGTPVIGGLDSTA